MPAIPPTAAQIAFLRTCYWTNDLIRPSDAGFGVIGLCVGALAAWNLNKKVEALAAQLAHGATSIEIFYLGKKEMV